MTDLNRTTGTAGSDGNAKLSDRQAILLQLQREYRHMELNRRSFAEQSQAQLRKQQSTIDKLRKDNEILKGEIALIMRSSNRPLSSMQQEILQRMHDAGDGYANAIEFEKRNIEQNQEQILIMKEKILHQRKSMGGVNASKENNHMIQKQIRILENRLEKALVKFNEAIAHNKTLRDEIDDLRRERVVYENIYRKMEKELQDRKQKMAEVIELSNQSYEQRDGYQLEIAAIEQANRKEQEDFEEQMIELGRMLENDLRLPTPSATGRFGGTNTNGLASSKRFGSTGSLLMNDTGGDEAGDSRGGLLSRSKLQSGSKSTSAMDRVQNFEEAFEKIKASTGISDIEELVRTFIKNEDHNFSLFNYVNEQNNEIEKYEEQIQQLREDEKKFTQESGEDVHQYKQVLKELESKKQTTDSMAEKYEIRSQDLQRIIESLKRGIQSLYDKMDSEDDGLGERDPVVSESNMVQYLGVIESRTNQILANYAEMKALISGARTQQVASPISLQDGGGSLMQGSGRPMASTLMGTGPKVPMGQELVHVNPPKLDDYQTDEDEEDDEDETRPFTREELKVRTLNRLQRRGQGNTKGTNKKGKKAAGR
jgi:chromosome segregation ATPase